MQISKELEQKMVECRDKFKEAYDLMREIAEKIVEEINSIQGDQFDVEEYIGICLIDHEDVDELIKMCKKESF